MDENYKNPSSNSRPLLHSFPTTRSTLFKKINVWLLLLQLVLFLCPVSSFLSNKQAGPSSSPSLADGWCSWRRWHLYSQTSQGDGADINSLRVSVIRSELKELGVNFSDCFDKESLVQRLKDAREQKHAQGVSTSSSSSRPEPSTSDTSNNSESDRSTDETSLLQEIRSMSVRDLRQDLASRNLRWAGLLEKEDLVQAVLKARKEALNFAVTGFAPGSVATLTGDEATAEIFSQGVSSPLLLDVYAGMFVAMCSGKYCLCFCPI